MSEEGYVFGETFDVQPVVFSVRDGLAVFEGDIILGTVEQMAARTAFVEERVFSALAIPGARTRWPDGVIPYEIDSALPAEQRAAAEAAVEHWNTFTRLSLVPRSGEPDYVRFTPGSGCSSHVGRQGGRQDLSLGTGCFFGQATHELGHAAGLWHEQSREDRDAFVTIVWDNIDPALQHNFDQHITDGDDVGPYDYGSIMHYPAVSFSINGEPTIVPVRPGVSIGQREALSPGDRAGLRAIYPELEPSVANAWALSGARRSELLYYLRSRQTWHLGSWATGALTWSVVGTSVFGEVYVIGDRLLSYTAGDWSVGTLTSGQLEWAPVGHRVAGDLTWTGRFGAASVLTFSRADGNWWLGSLDGDWSFAGNTEGFTADVSRLHVGDFNGDGQDELLVEDAGEWWLATLVGDQFEWRVVGSSAEAALRAQIKAAQEALHVITASDRGPVVREILTLRTSLRRTSRVSSAVAPTLDSGQWFRVGAFSGSSSGLLSYSPADADWRLGTLEAGVFSWSVVGSTPQFGALGSVHVLDLDGDGHDEVVVHSPADGSWWVGSFASGTLVWTLVGNSPDRPDPIWAGSFTGDAGQLLSYSPADATCRLGTLREGALREGAFVWTEAGTFEA